MLHNTKIPPNVSWLLCLQTLTIPMGKSSYPVTVRSTYLGCTGTRFKNLPACVKRNGLLISPALPPGEYDATLLESSNVVQTPPPIAVRVAPQRSGQ